MSQCSQNRNDNILISTSIVNPSFNTKKGSIEAIYEDARPQDIVDDACLYEVNVALARIPRSVIPIKLIDPDLQVTVNPTLADFNNMREAFRINYLGVEYTQNLVWIPQINLDYSPPSRLPISGGDITFADTRDKSYYTRYPSYYSLYNVEGLALIINNCFEALNNQIPTLIRPANYPCVTWNDNVQGFLIHLPPEYVYDSTAPTPNDIEIEYNLRMSVIFSKTILVDYGRLRTNDENKTWTRINNDIHNRPSLTDYDVSSFQAPFNNNIYTLNRNKSSGFNFQNFGGWNRIEIRSNIKLVKSHYVQTQNPTNGTIISVNSTQDDILARYYFNYTADLEQTLIIQDNYPIWQSVANSGALNNISYSINLVDNYGNRVPLRVLSGSQINVDLQLRKLDLE